MKGRADKSGSLRRLLWRGVGLAALLLFGGEFVLSVLGWRDRAVPVLLAERAQATQIPHGRLTFHPTRLFTVAAGHRLSEDSAGRQATGAWPFRGRPPEPSPPGLLRVLLVGDSAVHGVQLFERDGLAASLMRELDSRGLPPDAVAVLNLGVPGYTTLQIERLVREEVPALVPLAAAVLSTALWNDRAPASNPVHQKHLLQAADPGFFARCFVGWSAGLDWFRWGGNPLRTFTDPEEVRSAWEAGAPLWGPLVDREEAAAAMSQSVELLRDSEAAGGRGAGPPLVVAILPAHPFHSLGQQHGLVEDVEALRQAWSASDAVMLRGPELLAQSGLADAEAFLDDVHPSGPWNAELARAVADCLEEDLRARLGDSAARSGALEIRSIAPLSLSPLGDQILSVRVRGLEPGCVPSVLIGGQPLLDVSRSDVGTESILRGRTCADRPGSYGLVVSSERAIVYRPAALVREAPRLEYVRGNEESFPRLVLHSRPGDRLLGLWAADRLASEPAWSLDGDILLSAGARAMEIAEVPCGADGRAEIVLDVPETWPPRSIYLQGLVVPGGQDNVPGVGVASDAVRIAAARPGGPSASSSGSSGSGD